MNENNLKIKSRRSFLEGVLRYGTLAVLGLAAAKTVVRNRRLVKEGKCVNFGICSGCDIYLDCRLPQALSRKQIIGG